MLSQEDNERLTRVGAGTPMGELLRECWTPALRSAALEADGAPKRLRLLGENLVAFRATDGRVGVMPEGCPHRCASLALARNEGNGLRCIFHGWKFDVSGVCVDAPTEPADKRAAFAAKVPVTIYPAREAGGMVWVYMGRRASPPSFYDFEFHFPPAESLLRCAIVHGNWLQGLEGQLDSAHLNFLHSSSSPRSPGQSTRLIPHSGPPTFEFIEKPYGFREAAIRDLPDGSIYSRIREVVLPYYSLIPGDHGQPRFVVAVVPIDDEWSAHWYYYMQPFGPVPEWYREQALAGADPDHDDFAKDRGDHTNVWHQDRAQMKKGHWSGLTKNFVYEDFIIEESMGPIADRTKEYLGTSDSVITRTRRMFFNALNAHAKDGTLPFGLDSNVDYRSIRALAIRYPKGTDWKSIDPLDPPRFDYPDLAAAE